MIKVSPATTRATTACERTKISSFKMVAIVSTLRSRFDQEGFSWKTVAASSSQFEITARPPYRAIEPLGRCWVGYFLRWFAIAHKTMCHEVTPMELGSRTAFHEIRAQLHQRGGLFAVDKRKNNAIYF